MIREKDWNNAIEVARFVVKMKLPQERQLWVGDVAQDSVIRAFNKLHLYDETKGSFKSWVASIAKNVCIDFLRKPINKIYFKNDFTFISDEVEEDLEEMLAEILIGEESPEERVMKTMPSYKLAKKLGGAWQKGKEQFDKGVDTVKQAFTPPPAKKSTQPMPVMPEGKEE